MLVYGCDFQMVRIAPSAALSCKSSHYVIHVFRYGQHRKGDDTQGVTKSP